MFGCCIIPNNLVVMWCVQTRASHFPITICSQDKLAPVGEGGPVIKKNEEVGSVAPEKYSSEAVWLIFSETNEEKWRVKKNHRVLWDVV